MPQDNAMLDSLADLISDRIREKEINKSPRYKHTQPTGTPSLPYYTGPGGLFGVAGLERDVISTRIQPRGLASMIPAVGTLSMFPQFAYLTGFQDESGSNKTNVCDDAPVAGAGKSCIQTAQFGRIEYETREFELNRVGQQINRGEFMDLRLLNDPMFQPLGITNPNVPGNPDLRRETLMRFMEVGIAFQNKLVKLTYTGNPANNTSGNGYREFPGLDILINTGKVDALTNTSCPSLDSDIKNFNYVNVNDGGGDTLINVMSYLFRYVQYIAEHTNLEPVEWVIAMRPGLFWELSSVWPCSYLTYRCTFRDSDGNMRVNVDAADQVAMRDQMRAGSYLLIDGRRIAVIQDPGIVEETNTTSNRVSNGCFASDIYLIPMTVMGGVPVTYWEYLNYSGGAMIGAADGNLASSYFWTDGGQYLWHAKPPKNWCVQWQAKIEPRIILRTPHLAGRITNVQYCMLQHERDAFPDDPYFVNGGVSSARTSPSMWAEWGQVR